VDKRSRLIAPGIYWMNTCLPVTYHGEAYHTHVSSFLVKGEEKTLLIDCGNPFDWEAVSSALDEALDGRALDWIVPTHPEIPHSGNLARLLDRHPAARVVGDVRDYHVFLPEYVARLTPWPVDTEIDLGGGHRITLLTAPVADLVNTQWVYEAFARVMFVADAFAYVHTAEQTDFDQPTHLPGECWQMSSELAVPPEADRAMYISRPALLWLRFRPIDDLRRTIESLFARYPSDMIAPAHGSVINSNTDEITGVVYEAYARVHRERDEALVDLRMGYT
jgi:flavorubredoxin